MYSFDPTKLEWADYATVQALCENLPGNEFSRNLLGSTQPQLSQLTELLWTEPGLKSGISVHELISIQKKKKCRWAMNGQTFSPNPCK